MAIDATVTVVSELICDAQDHGTENSLDVVGMGIAVVEFLAVVPDHVLEDLQLARGSKALVDLERAEEIYAVAEPAAGVSAGSAANTVVGVVALGGTAGYIGKIADDDIGKIFLSDMRVSGVEVIEGTTLEEPDDAKLRGTGRCLVLITGGAERTEATHLGVASNLGPADVTVELVGRAGVLYLEGYLWDRPSAKAAMRQAVAIAHSRDRVVALSLSGAFYSEHQREELLALVMNEVDVLFANEHELCKLFALSSFEDALVAAEDTGALVAATCGSRGSYVIGGHGPVHVPAEHVDDLVDKTGASDLYAAGFLYALTQGSDPIDCGRLGSLCAAEIVSHQGTRPQHDLVELARAKGLV